MKKTILLTSLLMPCLASAATPIDGLYAGVFGGYAYLPNNLSVIHNNLYFNNSNYKSGFTAGGRFGYKNNPVRYEGEFTFIQAEVERFNVNGMPAYLPGGYADTAALTANIYYDMPEFIPTIAPFVGAGIGYAWTKNQFTSPLPFGPVRYTDSSSSVAYQVTTGLAYYFAENMSLDGAYRYFATGNMQSLGKTYQANLATLGVTYRFDGARYK